MPEEKNYRRSRQSSAVAFTIWSANGGSVPQEVVDRCEAAIQEISLAFFNDGYRLLTQTTTA